MRPEIGFLDHQVVETFTFLWLLIFLQTESATYSGLWLWPNLLCLSQNFDCATNKHLLEKNIELKC